jgi:hypothetical protein
VESAFRKAFSSDSIEVFINPEEVGKSEFVFATSWQTAYYLLNYNDNLATKLYFVQDYEPYFYPVGSEYFLAKATYEFGFTGVTAGEPLSRRLANEFGMKCVSYDFAVDQTLYRPMPIVRGQSGKRVFFYARPVTARRCFELGMIALTELCRRRPDVTVVLAGWDLASDVPIPFPHEALGTVDPSNLAAVYSSCDVALLLSGTNLSLLAAEVPACRCPVVCNRGEFSDWLLSEDEATYCDMNPVDILRALMQVLDHPEEAKARADRAFTRVSGVKWPAEARKVAKFLEECRVSR